MRTWLRAAMIATAAASLAAPASGQGTNPGDSNIPTETQERLAQGQSDVPWELLGLFGLLGLLGLRRGHPDDGYHPAPVE